MMVDAAIIFGLFPYKAKGKLAAYHMDTTLTISQQEAASVVVQMGGGTRAQSSLAIAQMLTENVTGTLELILDNQRKTGH
jgi:hypothetical protein